MPFVSSFACFLTRAADQIRMAGISRSNVKFCGLHACVSIGEDGPSQMGFEDVALLRVVPEGVVLYPADGVATEAWVRLTADHTGIVYLRTPPMKTTPVYGADEQFVIGRLKVVRQSAEGRLTPVAAGITLHEALAAHDELRAAGIAVRVVELYSVKPLDVAGLLAAARATGRRLLTAEDHDADGGPGSAVLEALAAEDIAVHRLAVRGISRSGAPRELLERYGVGRGAIVGRVREILGADEVRPGA